MQRCINFICLVESALAVLANTAYTFRMKTVSATRLKNHLGAVLRDAASMPVAIEKHGEVVAWLVPSQSAARTLRTSKKMTWGREQEERLLQLCADGDFRPSRWARAGDRQTLAGAAAMLASARGFDAPRMLALAERLSPGMSQPVTLSSWLATAPLHAERLLSMAEQRVAERL